MRTRLIVVIVAALLALSGCSANTPSLSAPKIDVDTPALRALKADAGIKACPIADAAKVHSALPDVTAPCLGGGRSVNLARLRGPLVINLWAQFCGPCRKEMPVLQKFYEQFGSEVPVLGIVENMSFFACPHCGEKTHIFSHGGGRATAERLKVPFLGEIPLYVDVRIGGDTGAPITASQPESPQAEAFMNLASRVAAAASIAAMDVKAQEEGFIPLNTLVGP